VGTQDLAVGADPKKTAKRDDPTAEALDRGSGNLFWAKKDLEDPKENGREREKKNPDTTLWGTRGSWY